MLTTLKNWHHRRETVRELSRLSDRELADIGIIRSEIESVARFAFEAPAAAGPTTTSRAALVRAASEPQAHVSMAGLQTQA